MRLGDALGLMKMYDISKRDGDGKHPQHEFIYSISFLYDHMKLLDDGENENT